MSYKSTVFLFNYMKGLISCTFPISKKIQRTKRVEKEHHKYVKCGNLEFPTEIHYGETSVTVPSNLASGHYLYS